jgi:predicted RNA-binding protein YlxR (DUF448 family)
VGTTLERRAVPTRTCVHCRSSKDKRELLRVVRTPSGEVAFDPTGKANGRGAYVCHDEPCIVGATGKGGLARALEATVPLRLADELRRAISRGTADGAE